MAKYRAGLIGRLGLGKELLNGQTVKTKILLSALADAIGDENIHRVDTYGGIKALLRLPFQCVAEVMRCRNVIMLPAHKGLRVIAPVLAMANIFTHRKLHYVVIGGWLPGFLEHKPFLRWCLKAFDGIYVETKAMKKGLEARGFENVCIMPNFKNLTPVSVSELVCSREEPYRVCTFSRVMREKGIQEAVEAVKAVNANLGRTVYTLDIFGQVDAGQTQWFESLQKSFPPEICYGGTVPFDKSVEVLRDYFALLFPTKFYTEGIPGTIIDAYAAGIPVVASMWENYEDIIDEETGICYPFHKPDGLVSVLTDVAQKPELLSSRKAACLRHARQYQPEVAVKPLLERIE